MKTLLACALLLIASFSWAKSPKIVFTIDPATFSVSYPLAGVSDFEPLTPRSYTQGGTLRLTMVAPTVLGPYQPPTTACVEFGLAPSG